MSVTEDRLKDSLSAVRTIITEDNVPALVLPDRRPAFRWLVPVGAAAAAAVVVVGGTVGLQQKHVAHRPMGATSAVLRLAPPAAPPKFYLAAVAPDPIAVYDTATGHKTGSTHISGITKVAATGDGRTFFATSDGGNSNTGQALYRITINGRGSVTATTRLSVRLPTDGVVTGLSASRDGSKVALVVQSSTPTHKTTSRPFTTKSKILVADLWKNTIATWQSTRSGSIPSVAMDSAARTLIFDWEGEDRAGIYPQIRALDLTLPGRDLMASRVLVTSSRSRLVMGPVALSPDGRYLAAAVQMPAVQTPTSRATSNVLEYATDSERSFRVVLKGVDGHSEYNAISFDSTGTNLLIWGGGHRISRVGNGQVATELAAPADIDTESTAAW